MKILFHFRRANQLCEILISPSPWWYLLTNEESNSGSEFVATKFAEPVARPKFCDDKISSRGRFPLVVRMKRNKKVLLEKIHLAKDRKGKAIAYYNLGLFHDNNARESEAIPNYELALKLGLDKNTKAKALAWLSSSLYKTGNSTKALATIKLSLQIADSDLQKFLKGLKRRIQKSINN